MCYKKRRNFYYNSPMDKVTTKKAQIIQQIAHYLIEDGLADIGLRKLAAIADTSDRMLIYYFDTKDALIGEVLHSIAAGFVGQLDMLLGQHKRSGRVLLNELLALSSTAPFSAVIQLWFEVVGLAARGQEPFTTSATAIANNWLGWIESRLVDPQPNQAIALFAELEGRLMLNLLGITMLTHNVGNQSSTAKP
ncbi:MAG: TetR/AcrR family transcriptional regulator [Caldilinea sp. CFX5]|nr:TetR/AcrR family transcriptional regulator [Caldilinea sp. CFX5]